MDCLGDPIWSDQIAQILGVVQGAGPENRLTQALSPPISPAGGRCRELFLIHSMMLQK
jgi:hypothetical protein